MSHADFEAQVDAALDGELDAASARALEAHLAGCASCTRFRDERQALRSAIAAQLPVHAASDALRFRVRESLRAPGRQGRRGDRGRVWRPLAIAASLVFVAFGSWSLARRAAAADRLSDEVLSSHVRSLMPGHLIDVASSDQHTVKPWFNGKLDFSPPVRDLAAQGFPLIGGRLDYVAGRSVAVLTYGRRQHVINVFVWPASRATGGRGDRDRQGYHELHWTDADYDYWVVSDLGLPELQQFVALLRRAE